MGPGGVTGGLLMEDTVYVFCYLCHRPFNSTSLPKWSEFLMTMRVTLRVRTGEERFLLDAVSQKWLCVGAIHNSKEQYVCN